MSQHEGQPAPKPEQLSDQLNALRKTIAARWPGLDDVVDAFVAELQAARVGTTAPKVGDALPPFLLPNAQGRLTALSDVLTDGPAVITFFRGRWCPYCVATKEAMDAARAGARRAGVRLVAITPEALTHFAGDDPEARIDLLCDVDNGYALALNLVVFLNETIASVYRELEIDPSANQIGGSWFVPIPASFVVDANGVVIDRHVDADFRNRFPLETFIARAADARLPASPHAAAASSA